MNTTPRESIRITCQNCGTRYVVPKPVDRRTVYRCPKCKAIIGSTKVECPQDFESLLAATIDFFKKRETILVVVFLGIILLIHLLMIPVWSSMVSDEHHYIAEARLILHDHQILSPEHPPLGKLFIASGIAILGDNPFGGRMPSVIFAVFSVGLFYLICRELAGRLVACLGTTLFAFESLNFVQSQLSMLDVFSVTFMLLAFFLYLRNRYVFSGLAIALSGLCKMTGLLGIVIILAHLFLRRRTQPLKNLIFFSVSAALGFIIMMTVFDFAATHAWADPITRISTMLRMQNLSNMPNLTPADASMVSFPWEWVLSPVGDLSFKKVGAVTIISPTVWVLIIPSMCYMLYDSIKNRNNVSIFAILWFASTYLSLIPSQLLSDRWTYLYYFYPTIGAVCLAICYTASRIWLATYKQRYAKYRVPVFTAITGYFVVHLLLFPVLGIWLSTQVAMKPLVT